MEKLKILLITQGVWSPQLGAVKVHIELKQEYERQGHLVDKISLEDIYPNGQNAITKIIGRTYPIKIHKILKKISCDYDVIDANFKCVPYSKASFNFNGVLLARSHGIDPVYEQAETAISSYKEALESSKMESTSLKTKVGNIYRTLQKKVGNKEFQLSAFQADIVHCLNNAEYEYFLRIGIPEHKLALIANGITDFFIHDMNKNSIAEKNNNNICFVGSWSIRKGKFDFNNILSIVKQEIIIDEFVLLGGHATAELVKAEFDDELKGILKIVPTFKKDSLLSYIKFCKVGIFPSYVEGFGLAVVEMLAAGIPVVAYNIPGPADILAPIDKTLLITPGDTIEFAKKVISILRMNEADYQVLANKCKLRSKDFLLSKISDQFLELYKKGL